MGFCIFNNVAIAARHAMHAHGLERVVIVDFDVHHGNGTEDIFAGEEGVLMVSTFQHPFYPYSGHGGSGAEHAERAASCRRGFEAVPRGGHRALDAGARGILSSTRRLFRRVRCARRGRHGDAAPRSTTTTVG
jgi:hypothetical protein